MATNDPTALNNNAKPSPLVDACRLSRTAGILDTQEANNAPLAANTNRVAQACRRTACCWSCPAATMVGELTEEV